MSVAIAAIWHFVFLHHYEHSLSAILYGAWLGLVLLALRAIQSREKACRINRRSWLVQVPGNPLQARHQLDSVLRADSEVVGGWRSAETCMEGIATKHYVRKVFHGSLCYRVRLHVQFLPANNASTSVTSQYQTDIEATLMLRRLRFGHQFW